MKKKKINCYVNLIFMIMFILVYCIYAIAIKQYIFVSLALLTFLYMLASWFDRFLDVLNNEMYKLSPIYSIDDVINMMSLKRVPQEIIEELYEEDMLYDELVEELFVKKMISDEFLQKYLLKKYRKEQESSFSDVFVENIRSRIDDTYDMLIRLKENREK